MNAAQLYTTTAGKPAERFAPANILMATDFSTCSENALDYALAVARHYDSRIFLAHVLTPTMYQLLPPEAAASAYEAVRQGAEQALADILISGRLREVPHEVILEEGHLWAALGRLIEEREIDLVVVGTHGNTGLRKVVLGSAAEEVFRRAACPVLTVGPGVTGEPSRAVQWKSVLFATDLMHTPERAATFALSLAQEGMAHLTLLHIVGESEHVSERGLALEREFFTHQLERLLPSGAELWCEPELAVGFGAPAEEILAVARAKKADLIVMGARAGRGLVGHVPFATAHRVNSQAQCPVLTVKG